MAESNIAVTSLSFINDLGFIASRYLVKEIVKTFGKLAKIVLEQRRK